MASYITIIGLMAGTYIALFLVGSFPEECPRLEGSVLKIGTETPSKGGWGSLHVRALTQR